MLGAIIGDIVGSRWEFNPTNNYNFQLFSDKNGFTDDTICTIAVADAILCGKDYGKSIYEWCRRYPRPMGGYGGRFMQWVMSNNPKPYRSFGNGSAMRVSPIAMYFKETNVVIEEAVKTAECTHNHPEGLKGAAAVAYAINLAIMESNKSPDVVVHHCIVKRVADEYNYNINIQEQKVKNKFDETCQGTVPVALWIIRESNSFEDAIRKAVSLGADADTLGAIVGSIAEHIWGIPEGMQKKALGYLTQEMKEVVYNFYERLKRIKKLVKQCKYYKGEYSNPYLIKGRQAWNIERMWVHDLAKTYKSADNMKNEMELRCDMWHWKNWANEYNLPLSIVGYIFRYTADSGSFMHECVEPFVDFLNDNYK